MVTPNLPEATCFIADLFESPFFIGLNLSGSSPPSPVFDLPPILFIATARVVWASLDIEPKDMAPVENLFTISEAGSTSAILSFLLAFLILSKLLIDNIDLSLLLIASEKLLNFSLELIITAF